jgi:hypothetical protein
MARRRVAIEAMVESALRRAPLHVERASLGVRGEPGTSAELLRSTRPDRAALLLGQARYVACAVARANRLVLLDARSLATAAGSADEAPRACVRLAYAGS